MWFDCSELPLTPEERERWLLNDAKLWLDSGSMFGKDGEKFERINVACPSFNIDRRFRGIASRLCC